MCPVVSALRRRCPTDVKFRRTTPGSAQFLLVPQARNSQKLELVDPKHPASRLPHDELSRAMAPVHQPGFKLRAFPKAVLAKPLNPYPTPPYIYAPERSPSERRVNVSLQVFGGKSIHKHAVIRNAVKRRLKAAIQLIVRFGASTEVDAKGKEVVVTKQKSEPDLVMQGMYHSHA